jgi:hypothetical protein
VSLLSIFKDAGPRAECTLAIVTASSPTLEAFGVEMPAPHNTYAICSEDGGSGLRTGQAIDAGIAAVVALGSRRANVP